MFEATTPLGFVVRVPQERWQFIVDRKHPALRDREGDVVAALESPDQVRRSRSDPDVFLFYSQQRPKEWVCAVVKRLDGSGFLITAYFTRAIKEGEVIWTT
jgi:hypothetical protein